MRRAAVFPALAFVLLPALTAAAMVGEAQVVGADAIGRSVVLIVGSRGNFCTGTAIARDLVLTAAHCVAPGADYKLVEFDAARQPTLKDVASVARHPLFDLNTLLGHRATADVALLKLGAPRPASRAPAPLVANRAPVAVGDRFTVAGYGVAVRGDGKSGGTLRAASLVATGQPGTLQIRLVDPATRGVSAGLGACTGDSGAPVFDDAAGRPAVIGVVSWSTGPNGGDGCGGITGVTPLTRYRDWIVDTAAKIGSPL
jgi:secreted trypsin-like serine protease